MAIGGDRENDGWTYIPERESFLLWNELSSLSKARKKLCEMGYKNPKTGKHPTIMSIRIAALRYAAKNPELAREEIIKAGGIWAQNKAGYYQWLDKEVAGKIFSDNRYAKWLEENKEFLEQN
jgi:hypothetical protein